MSNAVRYFVSYGLTAANDNFYFRPNRINKPVLEALLPAGNDAYSYDKLDNATAWNIPGSSTSPTYNGFNQVKTWGTQTYTHDKNGNLTSGDGVHTYKYDAENRLLEIDYVGTSNKTVFTYNALGQRIISR